MNYFTLLEIISTHNKYYTWYLKICQRASLRDWKKGNRITFEKHHILPKSFNLGGSKDKKNIVCLTLREHYIVHRLLPKFLTKDEYKKKMKYALWYLSSRGGNYTPTSHAYEYAKQQLIDELQKRVDSNETRLKKARPGKLNGMYGKTHTEEVKQKLANLRKKELTGKTYEELYGKEKSKKIKIDRSRKLKDYIKNNPGVRSGSNNGRAKSTIVTSPCGKEYYICGTLASFCKENNLSIGSLKNSLYTGKEIKGKNSGWKIRWA